MDESVTDKEEIKRRLQAMKLQYAKMQKKLTKSERRKSAKNHVRRVLAEQANALSPGVSEEEKSSVVDEAASSVEVIQGSSDGKISRRSGRRSRSLQRSISFKLEDSLDKDDESPDVEGTGKMSGGGSGRCISPKSTDSNRQQSSGRARGGKMGEVTVEGIKDRNNSDEAEDGDLCLDMPRQGKVRERRGSHGSREEKCCSGEEGRGDVVVESSSRMENCSGDGKSSSVIREYRGGGDNSRVSANSSERQGTSSSVEASKNVELDRDGNSSASSENKRYQNVIWKQGDSSEIHNQLGRRKSEDCKMLAECGDKVGITGTLGSESRSNVALKKSANWDMKDSNLNGQRDAANNVEYASMKVSRRSHHKKSRRLRSQDGSQQTLLTSGQRSGISSGETPSDIGETEGSLNSENHSVSLLDQLAKVENSDVFENRGESPTDGKDGACLRWRGMFQGTVCGAWSGISSYEIGSSTVLLMYQEEMAVLWVHTDHWEARSQWTTDEGTTITGVTLGSSQDSDLLVLLTLGEAAKNRLRCITYNMELDKLQEGDIDLPETLEDCEELVTTISGHQGVIMEKTRTGYCNIHFFEAAPNINFWQLKHFREFLASSFIAVEGATDVYLCLSSNQLSLWSPRREDPLLEVCLDELGDVQIDECLWSKAEEGLLFMITLQRPSSLALWVVNPATGVLLQTHSFMLPCAYDSLQLQDFSINDHFLAALYSNNKMLIWDVSSGRALAEIQSPDGHVSGVTATSGFLVLNGEEPHLYQICH